MASFNHGVRTNQLPTSLLPSVRCESAVVMAFGTAPIHRLKGDALLKSKPGNIVLCNTYAEAVSQLGVDAVNDDFQKWGLSEVAFSQFFLHNVSPVIFANLFDPDVHKTTISIIPNNSSSGEQLGFDGDIGQLEHGDIIGSVTITGYVEDTDFSVDYITGEVFVAADGSLADALINNPSLKVQAGYTYADPAKVTVSECEGGYDNETGKSTGIELVESAFPKFRKVPNILIAPNFSRDATIAMLLAAKTQNINGVFNAIAIADIPDYNDATIYPIPKEPVTAYMNVPAYKNANNLVSENLYLCYPRLKVGERVMNMSTQAASLMGKVDSMNGGIPYVSPSNKNLQCQGTVIGNEEVLFSLAQGNDLNGNGVVTAINFYGGWVLWGNRTACYPANLDVKDSFISSRRMLSWYGNRLILQWFSKVDNPMNNRLIQSILNSEAYFISSLKSFGSLLGGEIVFAPEDNLITDLMDGKIAFHIYLGLVMPAEYIRFDMEFDPEYISALFS